MDTDMSVQFHIDRSCKLHGLRHHDGTVSVSFIQGDAYMRMSLFENDPGVVRAKLVAAIDVIDQLEHAEAGEAHRQSQFVAGSPHAEEDQDFVDAIAWEDES
jgi:hypothetical protein